MNQEKNSDGFFERVAPPMLSIHDYHVWYYDAYAKLGPYCPKCKELATGFQMDRNEIRGMLQGKVDCRNCKKTHRMIYDDNAWKFDKD